MPQEVLYNLSTLSTLSSAALMAGSDRDMDTWVLRTCTVARARHSDDSVEG